MPKLLTSLVFFFSFLLYFPIPVFATQLIEDFDDGNSNGWVVVPDPDRTTCSAPWSVQNNRMEISINQFFCTTNIMPRDQLWNNLGNNYVFELDMTFVAGTDHNVAFRFTPSSPSNDWYDIHFQSPGTFVLERVPPGSTNNTVSYPVPNRLEPYHIKIIVETGNIEIFIDDVLALDYEYDPATDRFPTGRIALRAGTGADPFSETYFDNIVVTSLDEDEDGNGLDVPYFSQINEQWTDDQYDSIEATIGQVGCALSGATMVMNYHGVDQLPDGSPLDVGNLNDWLNQNPDGAWRNGSTSWGALMRLSRIMNEQDSAFPILDYQKISPPDFTEIDRILTEEEDPLIFEENKSLSPSGVHFTAATGVVTSTQEYSILDPLDVDRSSFLIPPDDLVSARYLFPTNTNLSYLILHADQALNTLITNPNSNILGRDKIGDQFSEIAEAIFDMGYPLAHDDDTSQTTGNTFWEFSIPDPITGEYQLELNTDESGWYEFELYAYDDNAEVQVFKKMVYVDVKYPTLFRLDYVQNGGDGFAVLTKIVDFETLKNDVSAMRRLGLFSKGLVTPLTKMIDLADRFFPGRVHLTSLFLDLFEQQLSRLYPRFIEDEAFEFLGEELEYLREGI